MTHSDITLQVARAIDKDLPNSVYSLLVAMDRKIDIAYLIVDTMLASENLAVLGMELKKELDKA